jgi:hypothetical protein
LAIALIALSGFNRTRSNPQDRTFLIAPPSAYYSSSEPALLGKYTARDRDPLNRTISISGLSQGTEGTVWVQPRGVDRTET